VHPAEPRRTNQREAAGAGTKLFINGESVDAQYEETFETYAPSTGEKIADVAKAGREDAQRAVQAARDAFDNGPWPKMSGKERAEKLRKVSELVTARSAEIAEIEARDGGGTIKKAMFADVPGGAGTFSFFADCAENEPDVQERADSPFPPAKSIVRREPYGVCTGIVPWNFPLLMAGWKIAPAIAAGNCAVLKPASFTSLSAIEMIKAVEEADIPPGVVNLITGPGGRIPAATSASFSVVRGVISDGFSTTALPAAIAGAIFQAAIMSG
jgi:acyl-CoA reductase-like NAD-dependent aldehyde dehydrogenase